REARAVRVYQTHTSHRPGLQRLDLDFAELHDALAVLQRDPPAGELAVLRTVYRLLPVEDHGELRSLGRDLVDVPFAAGLGHRFDLGHIDDGTGAIARVRALVIDIHFIAAVRADLVRIGAADEDAAVGFLVDPELDPELKVGVRLLRHQIATALV